MSSELVVRRLRVHGRVQGVGYRYAFADRASEAKVTGWVANRQDGTVEAIVAGTVEAVDALALWARQGPAQARVSRVDVGPAEGRFDDFRIAPTF